MYVAAFMSLCFKAGRYTVAHGNMPSRNLTVGASVLGCFVLAATNALALVPPKPNDYTPKSVGVSSGPTRSEAKIIVPADRSK